MKVTPNGQPTTIYSERISQYTVFLVSKYSCELKKVRKKAKNGNRYIKVPHLNQGTLWESDKSTRKRNIQKRLVVIPFPTGGHQAVRHRQGNMSKTNTNKKKKIHKRSTAKTITGGIKLVLQA